MSAGCPTAVTITITPDELPYKPGNVLTCSADGKDPTYTWTGNTNGYDITPTTGNTYTLVEGESDLTCTATVANALKCTNTASDTFFASAVGKCQIQHNSVFNTKLL